MRESGHNPAIHMAIVCAAWEKGTENKGRVVHPSRAGDGGEK